jgi:dTDP-4-amino-4,6-dideoxygalactose transaminase
MNDEKIYVTQPHLPPLDEFVSYLQKIWETKWLTNNGPFHQQLENQLADYLGVKYISLFTNGTLALITALQALNITGEVITTPYSFVATTHALWWNNIKPVFVDIEKKTCNINPNKIEAAITSHTTAIMPVHVYGNPCMVDEIERIADRNSLKVIYDAAHAFGVKLNGNCVLNFGDLSILSFHATKVFNTFEGGAIVCRDSKMKQHVDDLKNFGFRDEVTVTSSGINAKMSEVQAAMGLLQLKYIDSSIEKRKTIDLLYRATLKNINGLEFMEILPSVIYNYSYFPVFIDEEKFGMSRDGIYEELKTHSIFSRRYFYPLISQFSTYRDLESAKPGKMPIAENVAEQILCLPIYSELEMETVYRIVSIIKDCIKNKVG